MIRKIFAIAVLALLGTAASAQTFKSGRYEFATTTGDTSAQLSDSGQCTISTYLILIGTSITNDVTITTDTFLDDVVNYNNDVITGSTSNGGKDVSLKLVITNSATNKVTLNYTGTMSTVDGATVITGSFTSNGEYTGNGTFAATYFPDFSGQKYSGTLDGPDNGGVATNATTSFNIATNSDHSVTVTNFQVGPPLTACFTPPFHTIPDPNQPLFVTAASGVALTIYLQDSVGGQIWLNAYSTQTDGLTPAALDELYLVGTPLPSPASNIGTNNTYTVYYGITTNNSCNGIGGGDSPFVPVPEKHEHKHRKHRDRR